MILLLKFLFWMLLGCALLAFVFYLGVRCMQQDMRGGVYLFKQGRDPKP